MSKEKKNTQNEKRKLSRQERKQIDTLIRQAKGDGKPHTAQDSIPFERMYKDGICRLANGRYSKCIEFEDINYQLAQPDDKTAIFEALCDMYNSFDASISVQLSLISRHANKDDFKNSITIAPQNDDFDSIRAEYTEMLRTQLERGNNGLIKTKFLTFTVEAKDIRSARARLARIETDTLNHFKVIGAAARVLDGKQRLEVLHGIFHPDGERFNFAWEWLPASGLSVKDFIAPSSFRFGDGRMFQMGGKFGAVSFLQIVAPELSDRMLADFMDAENGIIVNLHIQSIDHNEAIKTIKRKITDLDRMKIEEQKKAIRSGYDMDIIPSDLATYGGEAKNLLRDLQSRNERMFLLTLLVLNLADTKQKLDNEVFGAAAIAQKYNCILTRLDYRQEQGLMSSIPLGENLIHIQRGLTTSSTAVFVPFTVQELFQSGEALYYGLNALSNNMILCDRKKLKNPNGLILGTPGSGKSFSAKGKTTLCEGWREIEKLSRAASEEQDEDAEPETVLPPLAEGQTFDNPAAEISERYTQPPKAFTEDTLLSAMENAGKEETPEDAERKGLGTTATRAGIIEKLISAGFAERKGKKLIPTKDGYNLAAILPEVLTSPQLTAEWETRLTGIAKGSDSPDDFMRSIEEMTAGLVKTYSAISEDKAKLFTPQREAIGTCPRCGAAVYEGKKNFYCSDRACSFVMWKNDRFFEQRKKAFTKAIAAALLKDGKVKIKGMYSTKTGKTFDGVVLLADTGGKYVNFRVEQNRK